MSLSTILLIALLAQAAPPPADAENKAKAQALLVEGSALYRNGEYAAALAKFEAAYAVFPSPKLWFNIGQANRDLDRPVRALDAFERYLSGVPDAPPDMAADARASVADLQKKLGRLRIDCETPGAEISLDGKPIGTAPLPDAIWATLGRHQVTASSAGFAPAIEGVDVVAGGLHKVGLRLAALAPPPPPPPAPAPAPVVETPPLTPVPALTPRTELTEPAAPPANAREGWWLGRKWTWVAAGSAVLLGVGATVLSVSVKSRYDELNTSCGSGNPDRPGCDPGDISSLSARQTTANLLWGLTGAAVVTASVLFFVEGPSVAVAPMAGEIKGLRAEVRF
jgi:hypothetical protein